MPKYRADIDDSVEFPINVDIQSGRVKKNFFFHLTARRMYEDELKATFGKDAENPDQPVNDFLRERITGWRGQRMVLDEGGKPADFSAEAFDAMLSVGGVGGIIFIAYSKAMMASSGDAGRRKNSGG